MEQPSKAKNLCSFCDYKSTRKSKLESHLRSHTGEKPFICEKCKRGFSTVGSLKKHVQNLHLQAPKVLALTFKCSLCPYATHRRCTLEDHIVRTHTGERRFPCQHPNCRYAAKSSHALQVHNIRIHTNERKFKCRFPNCGYRGATKTSVNQHFVTHSESRPFSCDFQGCSYRAKSNKLIKHHKRGVHNGGYKPFACSMCNHTTTTSTMLREHERTHLKEKAIKCNFSGCTFACKTKVGLNQHIVHCHTEKTFKCDIAGCSSSAASRAILERHKASVHYCEKVYKCPSCDFQTKYLFPFRNHQERHNNARQRIPCPVKGCSFRSINRDSLKRHVRYHNANLGCAVDGCRFVGRSSSSLTRHMKIHDPAGRSFPCPFCPKHFAQDDFLHQHLRTHTEEKPVKCPACPYASKIKHNMMRHVRRCHSNTFSDFGLDRKSTCDHCHVNFACAIGLAMHRLKLKTAVVVLTRLKLK